MATPLSTGGCPDEGLTDEDLQDIHEDILDRNERGVRRILRDFNEQDLPTKRLCCTEVELEPASHDHILNWLPLTALHRATLMDSHGILDAILTYAPNIDINQALVKNGYTPLHVASSGGVLASVNFLTSSGACLNSQDTEGSTPIHVAAQSGHKDVMSLLCVKGASVNSRDSKGQTPLHLASEAGHTECVDFLLAKHIDVNAKDDEGRTALHVTQVRGHVEVTRKLLDKRAYVDEHDKEGNTALHIWVQNIKSKAKGCADLPKLTAFHHLLDCGSDVNMQNKVGDSVLHLASSLPDDLGLLDMLMNQGADVNIKNVIGRSPIFCVQSEAACESLITHGAKCDLTDREGDGVLHVFADNCDVTAAMMERAIDNGAHVNHANRVGETAIHRACSSGSVDKVQILLDRGAWNDVIDNRGRSILHVTLSHSHTDLSMWLLDKNSLSLTHQDYAGNTLLHLAATTGNKPVISYLITQSVDINRKTSSGKTAATLAGEENHLESLRTILKNGGILDCEVGAQVLPDYVAANDAKTVKILLQQLKGKTTQVKPVRSALHVALENRLVNISNLLLDSGAEVDSVDKDLCTPLHILCKSLPQMEAIVPRVISKTNCSMSDSEGFTALHYGISACTISILSLFLKNGFDVTLKNRQHQTVLHVLLDNPVASSMCDKVKMLTRASGYDPSMLDNHGESFLHLAVKSSNSDIVQVILNKSQDVNVPNNQGHTPLHLACELSQSKVVPLLLQGGADVNVVDTRGRGALFYAVSAECESVVSLLLQHGAQIDQQDEQGKTCVMTALGDGHLDLCSAIFLESNPDVGVCDVDGKTVLHYAARYGTADIIDTVLGLGSDVSHKDNNGTAPIHQVADNPDVSVINVMLSRGADINTQDGKGNSLLHLCSKQGSYDYVRILLDNGADIEIPNIEGRTATHLAAMATDPDVIQLLVANEADIDVTDNQNKTPLMFSIESGNTENSSVLLEQGADVSVFNSDGDSALHLAVRSPVLDKNFLKLLTFRSRKIIQNENKQGQSALDILCGRNDIDMETFAQEINLEL